MRLAHTQDYGALRAPTPEDPWRVLLSGCLAGWRCGVDGTDYEMGGAQGAFFASPLAVALPFCPELVGLGATRTLPDLHGGDGRALLRGEAKALDQHGADLTEGMLAGARAMLAFARERAVDFAILTDMSGACGTQVISLGCRFDEPRRYQQGLGVAAALLDEAGFVVSQRDHRTLARLRARIDPGFPPDPAALDHHQHPWTIETFGPTP
jgi:uncharacterized protein YbbK (DUF523 family)